MSHLTILQGRSPHTFVFRVTFSTMADHDLKDPKKNK